MKKIFVLLIIMNVVSSFVFAQWNQVGDAISGENTEYQYLKYVEISGDGSVVVAGSTSGVVLAYEKNVSDEWIKIGDTFTDESSANLNGEVSINYDGSVVAMSGGGWSSREYVCVYERNADTWELLGDTIVGETGNVMFGYSFVLNDEGNVIAISATNDNSNTGSVYVYELNGESWELKGDVIHGEAGEMMGWGTDISSDGNTVVVGSKYKSPSGEIKVYEYSAGLWGLKGSPVLGDGSNSHFGADVSINGDGTIIAAGAPDGKDSEGVIDDICYVKVYEFVSGDWQQIGDTFYGNSENSQAGASVSLNAVGDLLAVGSPGYALAGGTEERGLADVLKLYDGIWRPYGNNDSPGYSIYGSSVDDDNMGFNVSLDAIGSTVAIGIPGRDENAVAESGVIEVYHNGNISNEIHDPMKFENIKVYPTIVTDILNIESDVDITVEIYSTDGKLLIKEESCQNSKIDFLSLDKGLYLVKINSGAIVYSTKIIKN